MSECERCTRCVYFFCKPILGKELNHNRWDATPTKQEKKKRLYPIVLVLLGFEEERCSKVFLAIISFHAYHKWTLLCLFSHRNPPIDMVLALVLDRWDHHTLRYHYEAHHIPSLHVYRSHNICMLICTVILLNKPLKLIAGEINVPTLHRGHRSSSIAQETTLHRIHRRCHTARNVTIYIDVETL